MEPVEVSVAHVAERDVVEGEAELVLVETADGDAECPLVGAVRVGGGDFDGREVRECRDGARAGGGLEQRGGVDGLDVAGFAEGGDGHGLRRGNLLRWRWLRGRLVGIIRGLLVGYRRCRVGAAWALRVQGKAAKKASSQAERKEARWPHTCDSPKCLIDGELRQAGLRSDYRSKKGR